MQVAEHKPVFTVIPNCPLKKKKTKKIELTLTYFEVYSGYFRCLCGTQRTFKMMTLLSALFVSALRRLASNKEVKETLNVIGQNLSDVIASRDLLKHRRVIVEGISICHVRNLSIDSRVSL